MPKSVQKNYQDVSAELDEVLASLQTADVQVDEAVKLYERGLQLVAELEKRITQTENTITKLTLQAERAKGDT